MDTSSDYYRMGRDAAASRRLVSQHYLLKQTFGWSLHPQVTSGWTAQGRNVSRKIADVACGNGIWTIEQATEGMSKFHDIEVTGFDISPAQFPHRETWPENVKFELWDIKTPPPEQFKHYFDVVNLRLVIAAVRMADEVPMILQNLQELLKPGGYMQWLEVDVSTKPVTSSHSSDSIVFAFADELYSAYGIGPSETVWVQHLPDTFSKSGWILLDTIRATAPIWLRKHMWDNFQGALEELVQGSKSSEIEKRSAAFLEEVGKYPQDPPLWIWQVVLCQKPAAAVQN